MVDGTGCLSKSNLDFLILIGQCCINPLHYYTDNLIRLCHILTTPPSFYPFCPLIYLSLPTAPVSLWNKNYELLDSAIINTFVENGDSQSLSLSCYGLEGHRQLQWSTLNVTAYPDGISLDDSYESLSVTSSDYVTDIELYDVDSNITGYFVCSSGESGVTRQVFITTGTTAGIVLDWCPLYTCRGVSVVYWRFPLYPCLYIQLYMPCMLHSVCIMYLFTQNRLVINNFLA